MGYSSLLLGRIPQEKETSYLAYTNDSLWVAVLWQIACEVQTPSLADEFFCLPPPSGGEGEYGGDAVLQA